ncbi:MAG: EAL domain-containing protein, partial [Candidatus Omnitrophica bacterium]|nr:EAL domain-containing protein [Candidatus Omnitrophota bacterium]
MKKHILLIDDEVDFAQTMAMRLQLRGYEVAVAHDGVEALERVKDDPDLILLDVMIPGMNGHEICKKIREDKATKNIPIIMLTAKNMSSDKIEGLQIGADDYINKSADMEELFARIEALLRRSGLFEEMSGDRSSLIEELKRILHGKLVEVLFQPVFRLRPREIFAYEVLVRGPKGSKFESPEKLFQSALSCGMFFDLEMIYRRKALEKIGRTIDKKLFIFNCSPYIIESGKFDEITALYDNPAQIILEITERAEIKDFQMFCKTVRAVSAKGFKISVDDVGSGYSSLDSLAEIGPDYAKINIALLHDIDSNVKKQNLVKTILSFCQQNKIIAIAEGIETEKELGTLMDLGVK